MGKRVKFLMPLGMIGVLFYIAHTIAGGILWKEYNPITTDISSLTVNGAPNARLLKTLTLIYSICMILFVLAMLVKSINQYGRLLKSGYAILTIMQITSFFGYSLFPLSGDKTQINFQNMMHIIVTAVVVITAIASFYTMSLGYLKHQKMRGLGKFLLVMSIIISLSGVLTPVLMYMNLNIAGLTERLVIYTLQITMFVLSYYHTFSEKS